MGWNVHLHACFACNFNEGVAGVARQHLSLLPEDREHMEARWFLADLAERIGANNGPKGGLSLWGIAGNGSSIPHNFVRVLQPFWRDLLRGTVDGGPCDHEHVVVFYEEEQSHTANVYEICWENEWPDEWGDEYPPGIDDYVETRTLLIKHHERLPFSWFQY